MYCMETSGLVLDTYFAKHGQSIHSTKHGFYRSEFDHSNLQGGEHHSVAADIKAAFLSHSDRYSPPLTRHLFIQCFVAESGRRQ
jgi:hypothetical protein